MCAEYVGRDGLSSQFESSLSEASSGMNYSGTKK